MGRGSSSSSSSQSSSSSSEVSGHEGRSQTGVVVQKLSHNVTQGHIREIFSHFGNVGSIFMHRAPELSSYALVEFQTKHEGELAISYMNRGYIDGVRVNVQMQGRTDPAEQKPRKRRRQRERQRERRRNRKTKKHRKSRRNHSSSSSGVSSPDSGTPSSS